MRGIKHVAVQLAAFHCGFWWAIAERQKWNAATAALLFERALSLLGEGAHAGGAAVIRRQRQYHARQFDALRQYLDHLGLTGHDDISLSSLGVGYHAVRTGDAPAPCQVSRSGSHSWEEDPSGAGERCAVCGDPRAPLCHQVRPKPDETNSCSSVVDEQT